MSVERDHFISQFREIVTSSSKFAVVSFQSDLDAWGMSFSIAHIIKELKSAEGKECDIRIVYDGVIGHRQNRLVATRFDLVSKMVPLSEFELHEDEIVILVDSSKIQDGRLPEGVKINPNIVIDHHRESDISDDDLTRLVWIEDLGAGSSMIVELMDALEIQLDEKENKFIAILLALGIYTDTERLKKASFRDTFALGRLQELYTFATEFDQLTDFSRPEGYFDHDAYATYHRHRSGPHLFTFAGFLDKESGDDLADIANHLIRMEGVTLVVVAAVIDKIVRASVRATAEFNDPLGEFLERRLDKFEASSGHRIMPLVGSSAGGFRIELYGLGPWITDTTKEEAEALIVARLRDLFLGSIITGIHEQHSSQVKI